MAKPLVYKLLWWLVPPRPVTLTAPEGSRISRAKSRGGITPRPADRGRTRSGDQSRETDLSAEQIGAQAPSWLSHPDGDERRPQGAFGAAGPRPQAAQCVIRHNFR